MWQHAAQKIAIFGICLTGAFMPGAGISACRQALALGLDISGSVDVAEYRLQLDGLANALQNIEVKRATRRLPHDPATAIGKAMLFGGQQLIDQHDCWRQTLDLSGDEKSNIGPLPVETRQLPLLAVARTDLGIPP